MNPDLTFAHAGPSRRQHQQEGQPPRLTTALGAQDRFNPHLSTLTPLSQASNTSLSSHFSGNPVPSSAVSNGSSRGSQAFGPRHSAAFNAPYNPQQYRSGGGSISATAGPGQPRGGRAPQSQDPDGPLVSPPPPYSPQHTPRTAESTAASASVSVTTPDLSSPRNSTSPYHVSSASISISSYASASGPSPASGRALPVTSTPGPINLFPPPPGQQNGSRSRSSSKVKADKPSVFSLSALTSRRSSSTVASPSATAIDFLRRGTADVLSHPSTPIRPSPQSTIGSPSVDNIDQSVIIQDLPFRPPASRRAASTGAIPTLEGSGGEEMPSVRSWVKAWEPGMPLPPPPPGPPPNGRSQSMSRASPSDNSSSSIRAPIARHSHFPTLGPVPPTPADWVDSPREESPAPRMGLRVDTSVRSSIQTRPVVALASAVAQLSSTTPSESLYSVTPCGEQPKGIWERRIESRQGKRPAQEQSNSIIGQLEESEFSRPGPSVNAAPGLFRRSTITKSRPRSKRFSLNLSQDVAAAKLLPRADSNSQRSTSTLEDTLTRPSAPTPPFSPAQSSLRYQSFRSESIPPKALPTPPEAKSLSLGDTLSPSRERPVSHILHSPIIGSDIVRPLVPQGHISPKLETAEEFAQAATERHRLFLEREASSESDQQRMDLFLKYIVTEAEFRSKRYGISHDIVNEMSDTINSMLVTRYTDDSSASLERSRTRSFTASYRGSDEIDRSAITLDTDYSEFQTNPFAPTEQTLPESNLLGAYIPSLSPIASMSAPTNEDSSRGRPSIRWWEVSQHGSGSRSDSPQHKLERSKRESKYMGISKEELQWDAGGSAPSSFLLGPDEYPPEKTEFHELVLPTPPLTRSSANTPGLPTPTPKLDVSRLVTLPPPYPRHHPAVNNNHPDLSQTRVIVRSLNDFSQTTDLKAQYSSKVEVLREEAETLLIDDRRQLRARVRAQIEAGELSYADGARAEAAFEVQENEARKTQSKTEFEMYQAEVVQVLHASYSEGITKASAAFDQLRGRLFEDSQKTSPNIPQEEGDERPELVEKLTLLKWLFEAREQLHRAVFDLLNERNERYKHMVTMPYRLVKNDQKLSEAEDFFRKDSEDRKLTFHKEALKRYEDFMDIVEENVVRGVEAQLSAFWDIAPSLISLTEKVPLDLRHFDVQIPDHEYVDNPSYQDFPMQYLYSLLCHTEKSSYQFIESQVNLLCLLHEVKSGVMGAGSRLIQLQRSLEGEDFVTLETEMADIRKAEEQRLTEDLKEKVKIVEDQWAEALGTGLDEVKFRVREFLMEQGAWDDEQQQN